MDPVFLLPFIDELKRLSSHDKPSKKSPIDRFYNSILFDSNVLSVICDFAQPTYRVSNYYASQVGMMRDINICYGGKEVCIMIGREWYRDRPVCYAAGDNYINISVVNNRTAIERSLLDGTYDNASVRDRSIIKVCMRRVLADPLLFK